MSYTIFSKKKTCIQCGRISLCCCCCCWWERQCLAWQIVKTSIISRCPNHLDWHLWILWSSHSTLKPFQNVFQKQKTRKAPGVCASGAVWSALLLPPASSRGVFPPLHYWLYLSRTSSETPAVRGLQLLFRMAMSSRTNRRWTSRSTGRVRTMLSWICSRPAQTLLLQSSTNSTQCGSLQIPRTHLFMGFEVVLTHTLTERRPSRGYTSKSGSSTCNLHFHHPVCPVHINHCLIRPQSRTGPDCNQVSREDHLCWSSLHQDTYTSRVVCSANQKNKLNKIDSDSNCGSLKEAECEHNPLSKQVSGITTQLGKLLCKIWMSFRGDTLGTVLQWISLCVKLGWNCCSLLSISVKFSM